MSNQVLPVGYATTISEDGLLRIEKLESFKSYPYLCSAGKPTIGVGSTHYEDGTAVTMHDKPITYGRAHQLLRFEACAKAYVIAQTLQKEGIHLSQKRFDILVSFAYNEGIGALLSSTLLKLIKRNQEDPVIRDEFMKWNKITVNGKKEICKGLTNRRMVESNDWFS